MAKRSVDERYQDAMEKTQVNGMPEMKIRVTLLDIYNKQKEQNELQKEQSELLHKHIESCNARLRRNALIAGGAMTLTVMLLGFLINHIGK